MMDMMNLDNFPSPFMPFHQKFDDSEEEGEIEDEDEDEDGFEFEDAEGGYELDDDYDEGDMVDVKPPVGVNVGDGTEMFEGIFNFTKRFKFHPMKSPWVNIS